MAQNEEPGSGWIAEKEDFVGAAMVAAPTPDPLLEIGSGVGRLR